MSNEESSPLFLASDFCRPRRRRRPRPSEDNRHTNTNNGHQVVVPVSVSILDQSLCPVAVEQHNGPKENCDQREEEDECVTIYSSSVSLFRALQLWDTSVCFLVGRTTPALSSSSRTTMAVLLRYDPRGTNDEQDEYAYEDIDRPTIYVPPSVAASVGLHSFASHQHGTYHAYLTTTTTITNNIQPPVAYKASVRPIGIPPTDYLPPLSKAHRIRMENHHHTNSSNHANNETADQNKDDAAIRCYFSKIGDSNNQTIPQQQRRLLTVGSIFGVVVSSDHDNPEHMRFYRVEQLLVHTEEKDKDKSFNQLVSHGWVSPNETEVTLLPSSPHMSTTTCPRLPNVSMAYSFYKSIGTAASTTTTTGVDNNMQTTPVAPLASRHHHPSMEAMVNALLIPVSEESSSWMPPILHVIGKEENHVYGCIAAAANIGGGGSNNNNNTSHNSVTGSLADRLNGLRQSLNRARRAAPCVLHISQLQDEFDRVEDLDIRHDQESRFLSCIFESSSSSSSSPTTNPAQSTETNHDLLWRNDHHDSLEQTDSIANEVMCSAPSVIVVVSTSKQLPAGPLLSSLLQAPVHITVPDEAYAKQLWQDDAFFLQDDASFEEVKELVLGLNAREIQFLRRRFVEEMQTHGLKNQKEHALMESLLKELENSPLGRVGASKLSSSLIPNVRWEDVGGLSHVREEVMDAIELPLAHPDMFAGSQRSGILLFGPPGTGKTLMGKAVATECGLPFLSVKGPELLGSYVGESEANVRAAFLNAREAAASTAAGAAILFFDELDSLAPRRGGVGDGGGVMDRVVSTLLSELDQNDHADGNVFVIGATNRPDLLDPSLLRPGRFDRLVYLGLPTQRDDRIKILAAQTRKFKFQDNQSASNVVAQVIDGIHPSLTGADFSAIASGALMKSLQRLCHQAETEAKRLNNQRNIETNGTPPTTAQDVLSGWDEDMLEPVVLAQDLLDAAQDVVPSVTEQDLVAYESLRSQFSVQKSS
eukprot:scaffold43696_cov48-Attheya_sp.AAC.6